MLEGFILLVTGIHIQRRILNRLKKIYPNVA